PHGEYAAAFKQEGVVFRAYTASAGEPDGGFLQLHLPYWLMSGDEIRSLIIGKTEHEATSQNNVVYKALKHARMVAAGIVKPLPPAVVGDQALELMPGKSAGDTSTFDRDKPVRFSLDEFVRHIDEVQGRKPGKTDVASA